jgi:hypothetical protein
VEEKIIEKIIGEEPRKIKCFRCGKEQTERVFGEGFMGWQKLSEVVAEISIPKTISQNGIIRTVVEKVRVNPELCPQCMAEFCQWLEPKKQGVNANGGLV